MKLRHSSKLHSTIRVIGVVLSTLAIGLIAAWVLEAETPSAPGSASVRPTFPPQGQDVVQQPGTALTYEVEEGASLASCTAEGYASANSVVQGGTIDLYLSSDCIPLDVYIFREGASQQLMTVLYDVQAGSYPCANSQLGCAWPVAHTLEIPRDWPSGLYAAQLVGPGDIPGDQDDYILFVVREDMPGSTSRMLVQFSMNTWNAYNDRHGLSFYTVPRAWEMSYDRPFTRQPYGIGPYQWEIPFVRWIESHGYTAEYCTNTDIGRVPGILDHYRLFASLGHDEYWSKDMRDNLEAFINRGGNAAFFSSNTCYWQVRMEDDGRKIVCYKDDYTQDPLFGVDNSRVTHYWQGYPVNRPENMLTGVSYHQGSIGGGGYIVYHPDHWVYQGTGLDQGDIFGEEGEGLQAREADGCEWTWSGGVPVPTGENGTPLNFMILGRASKLGNGIMGTYERGSNGGEVFTTGSWEWAARGLASANYTVERITRNVLDRLTQLAAPATSTPSVSPTAPPRPTRVTLQQGLEGYSGAQDTYIHSWFPNDSYASRSTLLTRPGQVVAPLLKFSLEKGGMPLIPPDAEIVDASLSLYAVSSGGNPLNAGIYKVLRPWVDNQATWNRAQSGINWMTPGCAAIGSDRVESASDTERMYTQDGWYTFDITELVTDWLANPGSNHGLVIKSHSSVSVQYDLASSEYATRFYRPKLVISYVRDTSPTATPTHTPLPTNTPTWTPTPFPTATNTPKATPTMEPGLMSLAPDQGWSVPDELLHFTTTYHDSDGWADIRYADFLISDTPDTLTDSVYLRYDVAEGRIYLLDRWDNTLWLPTGGMLPGEEERVKHGLVRLYGHECQVSMTGNELTVIWGFTLTNRFGGAHNLYTRFQDNSGETTRWYDLGDWRVNNTPQPVYFGLAGGSVEVDDRVRYGMGYRDPDGLEDLDQLYLLITDTLPTDIQPGWGASEGMYAGATLMRYDAQEDLMYLRNIMDTKWKPGGGMVPHTKEKVKWPHAIFRGIKSWVEPTTEKALYVRYNLQLRAPMAGENRVWMRAIDVHGFRKEGDSGWIEMGTLSVIAPAEPTPTPSPTATHTLTNTPVPTATPTVAGGILRLRVEAEAGTRSGPVLAYDDANASGCQYVAGTVGASSVCESGGVSFDVYIPRTDQYRIFTRVKAPDQSHNSFWVSVDGGEPYIWNPPPADSSSAGLCGTDGWCWDSVSDWSQGLDPVVFSLSQGVHTFEFCVRESDTRLDLIEVTTAYDFDTTTTPCSVTPTPSVAGVIYDTYLDDWTKTSNYGQDYYIKVRTGGVKVGLIRPDISHIPADAVVTEATLRLYVYNSGGHSMLLNAYPVNRAWAENVANWNQASTTDSWALPGCRATPEDYQDSVAASTTLAAANTWVELDLTDLTQTWINDPTVNKGILLKGGGDVAVQYTLVSSQYWDANKRPQFDIAYYVP